MLVNRFYPPDQTNGIFMTDRQTKPKILWDERGANHVRADSCTIVGSREEISLLFGNEPGGNPADVRFTNRVILNPFTAKQLSSVLNRVIRDYEAAFGALSEKSPHSTHDHAARKQKSSFLFQLVKELDVSIGYERSFKILERSLLSDRFLLGISKKEIEYKAQDRIIHVCEQMGMPPSLLEIFGQCLFDANYVHFGFEDDGASCIYKVYVEFWDRIKETLNPPQNAARPHLLHLGFKWSPFEPEKKAITRYTWHPWLTEAQILDRVRVIADPGRHGHVFETAKALINIAAARMPHQDILYLEVTEADNPRKSFDINIYRGGLLVGELYPLLARLGQHYNIPYTPFHELYNQVKTERFGHLSGGINREGKDFCTVYYGVTPIQEDRTRRTVSTGWGRLRHSDDPFSVEKTDAQAGVLLERVRNLGVPFGFERSFKVAQNTFLPDRFLAGFEHKEVVQRERVLEICRRINMPADFLERFEEKYSAANIVLFGFERSEKGFIYKAYLEFIDNLQAEIDANPDNPEPFEMFTGFKWDGDDPSRKVLTRYTCFPAYALRDMADQAARFFRPAAKTEPAAIVHGILDLASHRAGPREFLYFEANETGTDRSSFSINLYRAGLRMAEAYPLLLDMARYYAIPENAFHQVYEASKTQILGNVAGGIDRQGRDFLTFYYAHRGSSRKGKA